MHEIAGYAVAGLVAFRLVWGLLGSRNARFTRFVKGPAQKFAYLGDMTRGKERRYLGHNPAGAAMIMALLVTHLIFRPVWWTGSGRQSLHVGR